MANLKVFISSTCYDLHTTRAQLRGMLLGLGYEPVMSDQSDVIYDPRAHTHSSCLREVTNCDFVILLVGSRFGGTIVPKALEILDLDHLSDLSRADRFGEDKTKISITQAEVLQAIQTGLPIFAFIDTGVMRDHLTYEKNKNKSIIHEIEFSSIDKTDTASYIFEFINFLRLRNENNSIFEFSRFEDIEILLKKQWAGLFQRLLHEQRTKSLEGRRIDNLSSQIADLKAAVLGSISSAELKETAKGAIRFRLLLEFLWSLTEEYIPDGKNSLLMSQASWEDLLKTVQVSTVKADPARVRPGPSIILLREDDTYCRASISLRTYSRFADEWLEFRKLGSDARDAILNAVLDGREDRVYPLVVRYNEPYIETASQRRNDESDTEPSRRLSTRGSRILLTTEGLIEDMLKTFLVKESAFTNKRFLIEVDKEHVKILVLPGTIDGKTRSLVFPYQKPEDGNLGPTIEKLKAQVFIGIASLEKDGVSNRELDSNPLPE